MKACVSPIVKSARFARLPVIAHIEWIGRGEVAGVVKGSRVEAVPVRNFMIEASGIEVLVADRRSIEEKGSDITGHAV